ncbi:MFS transporter [Nonomuraea rhodomycinica]|uniref:MFS transporter n=1 Tax=Nonomuraea rhodomycinica TaxID=1712872 RepID=A0A7Y6MEZ0_9ACTN|nr:MFS transporter [Nonomuraea rhodomycinica]NUW44450.1 MFS transporter [Nonomuraea rhodomycinica]
MTSRRDIAAMLLTTFLTWMGQRTTAVALPLVALAETGSPWTTGLVGGAVGLPMLTSAWWARGLRQRLTTGRALAGVLAVQVAGLLVVPVGAALGTVGSIHLAATGLITGCATAVGAPAQRALLADLCDRLGAGVAARMLAWQDFAHRSTMILAPPLAGWAITATGPFHLLWAEAAGVGLGAAVLLTVRGAATATTGGDDASASPGGDDASATPGGDDASASPGGDAPALRHVLARHPEIRRAVTMSGVGGLVWFAFTLGLAILGAETGRPGLLISAGMTGYGAGSLVGALLAPAVVPRLPALGTMATGWVILGASFIALPAVTSSLPLIACLAAAGGFAMPLGIGSMNRLITVRTDGAERRAAFAAESLVHDGAVSLGLLAGGAVIGLAGAGPTLVVAGAAQVAVALVAGPWLIPVPAREPVRSTLQ